MTAALEVRGVTRRFGALTAVDDVSFGVAPGEICGFIGPNGAGKTTTMRICATLDLPDGGDVLVSGRSVLEEPRLARARLGFMPDAYGAYPNTTVREYLDFFGRAYGLRAAERRATMERLIEFTSLGALLQKPTTALSKGMKQRLCLAKTLLHDPDLLILDEPAAGLDPRARIELRELVKALAGLGKAILVSSHILTELGEMCDTIVVIEGGAIRAHGNLEQIARGLRRERQRVYLRSLGEREALLRTVLEQAFVEGARLEREGVSLDFAAGEEELAALVRSLVAGGVALVECSPEEVGLEDVFLQMTDGRVQ